ncbi:MAG: hypothetical protein V1736_06820 [Pseudomonadota bacterium]
MTPKEITDAALRLIEILISAPFIAFLVLLAFHRQLSAVLPALAERLRKVKTPLGEIELGELKTVETALGKTELSGIGVPTGSVGLAVVEGFQQCYIAPTFMISWPASNWSASVDPRDTLDDRLGSPARKILIVIARNELIEGVRPNINVLVELAGNINADQYVNIALGQMQSLGWDVTSANVDKSTQAGVIELRNPGPEPEKALYQFQRIILASGKAYVVTASIPDQLLGRVREELAIIVNSFRLLQ